MPVFKAFMTYSMEVEKESNSSLLVFFETALVIPSASRLASLNKIFALVTMSPAVQTLGAQSP